MDKAVEYLRKKGIAKAEKRAGRAASEGKIVARVSTDGKTGALVELNSETDFVARNEDVRRARSRRSPSTLLAQGAFDGVVGRRRGFAAAADEVRRRRHARGRR